MRHATAAAYGPLSSAAASKWLAGCYRRGSTEEPRPGAAVALVEGPSRGAPCRCWGEG